MRMRERLRQIERRQLSVSILTRGRGEQNSEASSELSSDVAWLIQEVERLGNLKLLLLELGNRLVLDHGWEPVAGAGARTCGQTRDHTGLINGLTKQINDSPAMREVLTALGFEWPVIEKEVSDV